MKYMLLLLLTVPAFAYEESDPLKYSYLGATYSKSTGYTAPTSDLTATGIFAFIGISRWHIPSKDIP